MLGHRDMARRFLLFIVSVAIWLKPTRSGMHEKRLLAHLFNQTRWDAHNPMERPSAIEGKPLQVYLKCYLNQIMDMDEKNQVLSTIIWLDLKWTDYHFKWDSNEYGNVRQVNLPPNRIWKPDLLLYNSASEKFDQIFPTNVIVQNTGAIAWIPPGLFHSICAVKVNWFPFDSQSCILKFGTWSYQGNTVDLKLQCDNETEVDQECNHRNEVDLSAYLAHSEWALESGVIRRYVESYGEADELYIAVIIRVDIQRKALYYMFNIIVPCMIMSVMSLLVFTLPPDANEKIVLGVTTLLSLTMLLQLVGDKLPQTSAGNPVLVLYFTCTIVLCSLSLVCAVVLLNCHHHSGGILHVPWLIGTFVNVWLASVLRIDRSIDDSASVSDAAPSVGSPNRYVNQFTSSPLKLEAAAVKTNTERIATSPEGRHFESWTNNINDMEFEFRPKILKNTSQKSHRLEREQASFSDRIELRNLVAPTFPQKGNLQQVPAGRIRRHLTTHVLDEGSYSSGMEYACAAESDCQETNELQAQTFSRHRNDSSTPRRNNFTEVPLKITARATSLSDSIPSNQTNRTRPVSEQNFNVERQLREFHEKALILSRLKDLTKEIRYVTGRMHHKDAESRTSNEWRLACRVLDRLCLIVFAALNLFTTLGILTSAPTIIKAFTTTGAPSQPM
ncbi:acetylcholine receptor subunit alpha-type acr-16 [Clonorchis sinensis]|uniref:Acetylcholine receptor subunit alpha-type acr-16 n=1 Tax=Clonorchis sinensis TaxID=79923 RepID=G7YE42_CLOSI|nr:acetylcholine receptor subunit alpha-type acr-16 [Clonorchis sinensis]